MSEMEPLPDVRGDEVVEGQLDEREQLLANFVLHQVQQNLNLYVGGLQQLPISDLERLKALDEEAFRLYLRRFERQHESDIFMAEAPYRLPYDLARGARPYAIAAILALCAVAAYLAHLGATGKALIALFAIIVPVAVAFLGSNSDNGERTDEDDEDDGDDEDQH